MVAGDRVAERAGAVVICDAIFSKRLPCSSDFTCLDGEHCSPANKSTAGTNAPGAVCCPVGTRYCVERCDCITTSQPCTVSICPTPGSRYCDGQCVDATRDRNNCGYCGNVCRVGENCSNGHCCPKGTISCDGRCVAPIECS